MKKVLSSVAVAFVAMVVSQPLPSEGNAPLGYSDSPLSVTISPAFSLPLPGDAQYYGYGYGGEASIHYKAPFLRLMTFGLDGGYTFSPLKTASDKPSNSLSSIFGGAVVGIGFEPIRNLVLEADVVGGYWYGFLNSSVSGQASNGSNPYVSAGIRLSYVLVPWLSVGLEGRYRNYLGNFHDMTAGLSFSYLVQTKSPQAPMPAGPTPLKTLELSGLSLENVFPVFYKYYDDHPLGKAVLKNTGQEALQDVAVKLYVKQYMDNPKLCVQLKKLDPGQQVEVRLYGLFTDRVLGISEGTKVSAVVTVECTDAGTSHRNEYVETLTLYDRNAMTWDDDQKAAAFIAAKDPSVLRLSKYVAGIARDKGVRTLNKNLLAAMCMHEALALYGLRYVVDPSSAYTDFSANRTAVDYLQFPNQTLNFKAGDCDDLSILNAALLESVGMETALITVPGHIFMAFSLDLSPEEARKAVSNANDLIFFQDKTWVPVEITSIDEGFLVSWQKGSREWREYSSAGTAKIYPVHSSWELYAPVGFSTGDPGADLPKQALLESAFQRQLGSFVDREIRVREADLRNQIKAFPNDPSLLNRLGLLYAQYGQNEKAISQFNVVLKKQEYWPTLVNLGNLSLLSSDLAAALSFFDRAAKQKPMEKAVILGQARANYELGNGARANELFQKLRNVSPSTAEKYAYLSQKAGDSTRASASDLAPVLWAEE